MNGVERTRHQPAVQRQISPEKEKKLRKACADFEAMLTYNLLKTMRRTIPAGGTLPRSPSRESYETMMDQSIADTVARKSHGIGLQKVLYDQFMKQYRKNDSSLQGNASINMVDPPVDDK
jgi:flagellar protein FlgJ